MNTQLLCLFTNKGQLDTSIDFILKNYTLQNNNIFVLESKLSQLLERENLEKI